MHASSSPSESGNAPRPDRAASLLLAATLGAFLLAGCAGGARSIPDPTAKHLEYAEKNGYPSTLPSLKNGRRLYVNRCSGCHTLHKPESFSAKEWPAIVQDMASNAEINEDQVRDITRYLVAVSASQDAGIPSDGTPAAPSAPKSGDSAPASAY